MTGKRIEKWTAADWIVESVRLTGDDERDGDAVICGAVLLASLREGPKVTRIAKAIGVPTRRIRHLFDNLVRNGIFTSTKVNGSEWFDEESGGVAFNMAVACGLGYIERVSSR